MGWFTKSKDEKKKPKIREDLWIKCPKCNKIVFRGEASSCIKWCKYAKECVGEEKYKKRNH